MAHTHAYTESMSHLTERSAIDSADGSTDSYASADTLDIGAGNVYWAKATLYWAVQTYSVEIR